MKLMNKLFILTGGVTSMDSFLERFFPSVYEKEQADKNNNQYCKFDSQLLTTFTSSLYIAALVASFLAATVTRVFGRKWSMFGGGLTFLVGAALNGAAKNVLMLILGRILLGIGVGFANQVNYFLNYLPYSPILHFFYFQVF
jgi:MFS transporter, SP family, sugar:H+ symporter